MSILAIGLIKQPMLKAPQIFLQIEVTGPITEENGTQEETWRKREKQRGEKRDVKKGEDGR
jgi:hypothetical protein